MSDLIEVPQYVKPEYSFKNSTPQEIEERIRKTVIFRDQGPDVQAHMLKRFCDMYCFYHDCGFLDDDKFEWFVRRFLPKPEKLGHLYVADVGGYTKIGWAADPATRLRSYGAAFKSGVQFSSNVPKNIELNFHKTHRKLFPKEKGRSRMVEWYKIKVCKGIEMVSAWLIQRGITERPEYSPIK